MKNLSRQLKESVSNITEMRSSVDFGRFKREFRDFGEDSFSDEGLAAIYDYLEEIGDVELDVIAIRSDFSEYEDALELYNDYSGLFNEKGIDEESLQEDEEFDYKYVMKDMVEILSRETLVIPLGNGGVVIGANF